MAVGWDEQRLMGWMHACIRLTQVGSTNAMRVVGTAKDDGREAVALYAHEDLETCVGVAIAAFAAQLLFGRVAPGVYYPEEGAWLCLLNE